MREIAQRLFPNNWEQRGNLFLLRIGIYRIKLKKFDASLSSSSYLTQAVFDFLSQTYQTLFEKDVINLQLGYIPLGPSLSDYPIWIMMPKGLGATAWQCELRQSTAVELRPIPPATNPNVPAKPRVTLKPSKQRKGEQGKDE
jgi:hypothetical protein